MWSKADIETSEPFSSLVLYWDAFKSQHAEGYTYNLSLFLDLFLQEKGPLDD